MQSFSPFNKLTSVELTEICLNPKQKPYLVGTSEEMDCGRGEDL